MQKGDSLSSIASKYGTTWQAIYELNKATIGSNPNLIYAGQKLLIKKGDSPHKKTVDELAKDKWEKVQIDEEYKTNIDKVYAAGDVAGVKSTVAWASFSGREAAVSIYNNLK